MNVEVLVVPNCPHEGGAQALVQTALSRLNLEATITTTTITTEEEAQARAFTGSPTFLLDNHDPFAEPNTAVGVSCRLYQTPDGLAGLPSIEQLQAAFTTATRP